jgi:hypothetical protein
MKKRIRSRFRLWVECPSVVEIPERSVEIFNINGKFIGLEQNLAGEGFADRLVPHRHIGNQQGLAVTFLARTHAQRFAQRQEFRIALDIGHQIEHLAR